MHVFCIKEYNLASKGDNVRKVMVRRMIAHALLSLCRRILVSLLITLLWGGHTNEFVKSHFSDGRINTNCTMNSRVASLIGIFRSVSVGISR